MKKRSLIIALMFSLIVVSPVYAESHDDTAEALTYDYTSEELEEAYYTIKECVLYADPSTKSDMLGYVPKNQKLKIYEMNEEWAEVGSVDETLNIRGFLRTENLIRGLSGLEDYISNEDDILIFSDFSYLLPVKSFETFDDAARYTMWSCFQNDPEERYITISDTSNIVFHQKDLEIIDEIKETQAPEPENAYIEIRTITDDGITGIKIPMYEINEGSDYSFTVSDTGFSFLTENSEAGHEHSKLILIRKGEIRNVYQDGKKLSVDNTGRVFTVELNNAKEVIFSIIPDVEDEEMLSNATEQDDTGIPTMWLIFGILGVSVILLAFVLVVIYKKPKFNKIGVFIIFGILLLSNSSDTYAMRHEYYYDYSEIPHFNSYEEVEDYIRNGIDEYEAAQAIVYGALGYNPYGILTPGEIKSFLNDGYLTDYIQYFQNEGVLSMAYKLPNYTRPFHYIDQTAEELPPKKEVDDSLWETVTAEDIDENLLVIKDCIAYRNCFGLTDETIEIKAGSIVKGLRAISNGYTEVYYDYGTGTYYMFYIESDNVIKYTDYEDGWETEIIKEADCINPGSARSVNKYTKEETVSEIDPLGHVRGDVERTEPTLWTDGEEKIYCDRCGELIKERILSKKAELEFWQMIVVSVLAGIIAGEIMLIIKATSRKCTW